MRSTTDHLFNRRRRSPAGRGAPLLWALATLLLSGCEAGEHLTAYLDYRHMRPPIKESPYFEIVGHRGYGSATPENTLAALRRSIDESVGIAEVDVRLTSDGVPVLLHDPSLARTTGDPHQVRELSLAEVKKLDAGAYKSPEYAGEPIPTLEEALLLARGKLKMLLHMKLPESGPVLARVIRRTAFPESDLWIMSDVPNTVAAMHTLLPRAQLVHLVFKLPPDPAAQLKYVWKEIELSVARSALALQVPDEEYMSVAHRAGLRVLFWTADHPYDSVEVDRFTADGVITNKPLMWQDWAARIKAGG